MSLSVRIGREGNWFGSSLVVAVGVIVLLTNFLVPTLVGVYVDSYGLSIGEAGYTAAVYMTGAGTGAVLASWLLLPVRTPILLAVGLGALALGNLASIFAHSFETILAVRLVAGLGEGASFALMGAGVSRMSNPNRVYGIFMVVMLLMAATLQYCIPWLRSTLGPQMLFVPIAVAPACVLPLVGKFPNLSASGRSLRIGAARCTERSSGPYFWSGILATLVVYIAYGGGFAYIERIGVHTGIAADTVAGMLGMGYLISVGGALATILTANLRGRAWKISISLLVVAGATLLTIAGNPLAFRIGVTALFFSWYYFAPNLLGLMALADPSGRLAAAVTGAMEWGLAIGPAVAALWVRDGSFTVVAVMGVSGFLLAMLLLVPVLRHVSQIEEITPTPALA